MKVEQNAYVGSSWLLNDQDGQQPLPLSVRCHFLWASVTDSHIAPDVKSKALFRDAQPRIAFHVALRFPRHLGIQGRGSAYPASELAPHHRQRQEGPAKHIHLSFDAYFTIHTLVQFYTFASCKPTIPYILPSQLMSSPLHIQCCLSSHLQLSFYHYTKSTFHEFTCSCCTPSDVALKSSSLSNLARADRYYSRALAKIKENSRGIFAIGDLPGTQN